jgi:DNA-directed RNA polymerase specialized sigma24 family protein
MTSVAALRPRPDRSFERLYRRRAGELYRFALALLQDPHEAEAATQDAFADAYRALQRGERPARAGRRLTALVLEACREREPAAAPTEAPGDDRPIVCGDAELAISRWLDGLLARQELDALAIHLAWCVDCSAFVRRQRTQRTALRALTQVPLPPALATWTAADSAAVAGPM